jgi:hypothetical protein
MRVLAARSALLSTLSRWSASPSSTPTSQVPHKPSPQSQGTSMPAACRACSRVWSAATVTVVPESFSTASNACSFAGSSSEPSALKCSTCSVPSGQPSPSACIASIRRSGPQQ